MIRNAWYAVCRSEQVESQPVKYRILNQDYVLVRDSHGTVHAHAAYCPHRGCDLSAASYNKAQDVLICPFHGWQFDAKGTCVHIPANRTSYIPEVSRLATYMTLERNGLIWLLANRNAKDFRPFETFPELKDAGWRRICLQKTWNAHFTRVVESVLDVSHLPFVHPETTGRDVDPTVRALEYDVTDDGMIIYPVPFAPSHPMEPPLPHASAHRTVIELRFPNQWIIRTPMEQGKWMCTFLTFTPVDKETTRIFGFVMRNFDHDAAFLDAVHVEHTDFVMGQDQAIIESLQPKVAPANLREEAHVPSDAPTIRFRSMLYRALQAEGR